MILHYIGEDCLIKFPIDMIDNLDKYVHTYNTPIPDVVGWFTDEVSYL